MKAHYLAFAALAVPLLAPPAPALNPRLIAPGVGIGHIHLGEDADRATRSLGPQQDGDGAMGHFWGTWYSRDKDKRRTELDVYSVRVGDGSRTLVEQVRVTSPYFRTAEGVGTVSTLAQIRRAFPALRAVSLHAPSGERSRTVMYDDRMRGIAFEFARSSRHVTSDVRCMAVLVHPRGKSATDEYSAWPYNY